ncbi:hypothetical protein Bbelb_357480 [Branchiostoma belcheri]|nr:hypothetical protein Bbelb_357480 [Branchiostoma belcheri]
MIAVRGLVRNSQSWGNRVVKPSWTVSSSPASNPPQPSTEAAAGSEFPGGGERCVFAGTCGQWRVDGGGAQVHLETNREENITCHSRTWSPAAAALDARAVQALPAVGDAVLSIVQSQMGLVHVAHTGRIHT